MKRISTRIMIRQQGFTLIELMIVVAIIGIIASIAIPQYQIYTIRSRVAEGLVRMAEAKNVVTENASAGSSTLNLGWSPIISTPNLKQLQISDEGIITLIFGTKVAFGDTLIFRPADNNGPLVPGNIPVGNVNWTCDRVSSSLEVKFRPPLCR